MGETNSKQDKLYNGVPCVWDGEKYIVFSQYAQKIVSTLPQQLYNLLLQEKLENIGFFRKPLNKNHEEIAKISLILTTDCNLNCKYCYIEKEKKPLYMQPDFAIRALKEVIKPTTQKIYLSFFGGEPTLNMPVLETSVKYIKSLGIDAKYHIVTNGVISDKALDYLISNRFTFTVSMDGLPEINDIQRPTKNGKSSSKWIEKTIKKLSKEKTHFQVRITVTRFNVNRIAEAIEYWASLGAKFVHFELVSIGKSNFPSEFSTPNAEIYLKNVKKTLDRAEELGVYVINSSYMNLLTPSEHFCTLTGSENFLFTPDGGVSLCYRVQSFGDSLQDFMVGKYKVGTHEFEINIPKLDKFKNIKVDSFEECKSCFAKYICGSGCPYRNFIQTDSLRKVDKWMCDIKREMIHDAIIRIYKSSKENKESVVLGTTVFENLEE